MSDGHTGAADPGSEVLSGGVRASDYRALLRNRDFSSLTLATVTSTLGDWIGVLAILTLTVDIMEGTRWAAFAISGVMTARVVPSLLLGPIAGVFVDRWNRKRVLITADIARGTVMALIPFTDELLTLVLATLVIEVMSALFAPAKDAIFPRLVRRSELVAANQVNLVVTYGTLPLGGVFYAGLMSLAGQIAPAGSFLAERLVALPIWFNAASFLISAPLLARLRVPANGTTSDPSEVLEQPGAWAQLKEGFGFVATHPVIRALIVGVMIAFVSAGAVISLGELFAQILNAGGSGFGILVAVVGAGLLVGLLLTGPLTARVDKERLFAPGIGLSGGALAVTALMPTLPLASLTGAVMGLGGGVAFIVGYTILQERTADVLRGRTFAAFHTGVRVAILGATVAAPAVVGILGVENAAETLENYQFGGVRTTLLAAGLLALAGAVLTGRWLASSLTPPGGLRLGEVPSAVRTRRGRLVVFEGGDGAGKSTQLRLLRRAVEEAGHDVVVTREPGGTALGEAVRELLLRDDETMSDRAEALLYAAARAQHVDEVIAPALEAGTVVLSDRYVDSSVVYQGAARGLGEAQVIELNRWATGQVAPDLVVLLDVDSEVGLERLEEGTADRLEAAGAEFHQAVNRAFRRLADEEPGRYLVLDASRPVDELHEEVRDAVLALLRPDDADAPAGADPAGDPEQASAERVAGPAPGSGAPRTDGDPGEVAEEQGPPPPPPEALRGRRSGPDDRPSAPDADSPSTEPLTARRRREGRLRPDGTRGRTEELPAREPGADPDDPEAPTGPRNRPGEETPG